MAGTRLHQEILRNSLCKQETSTFKKDNPETLNLRLKSFQEVYKKILTGLTMFFIITLQEKSHIVVE